MDSSCVKDAILALIFLCVTCLVLAVYVRMSFAFAVAQACCQFLCFAWTKMEFAAWLVSIESL